MNSENVTIDNETLEIIEDTIILPIFLNIVK